ncbi:hypothetical protein [Streptomyces sp. NBC_01243]|uniref:hypothetical protein n=1 Tax=Streptomyces sp. NBC_01243 TaxID=2903796 RepID=UPI002E151CED|nr:hypothetical protein OG348_42645 [Streptomyces sp. NBC_01243]
MRSSCAASSSASCTTLLKLELATSVRAAGHHAELEVRRPCTGSYHTYEYLGLLLGELILLVWQPWWAGSRTDAVRKEAPMETLSTESRAGPGLRDQMVSAIEARALMTVTGDDAADVVRAVRTVLVDLGEHDIVDVVAVAPYSTKTLVDALWTGLHQERWARPRHTEEALRHVDGVLARRTRPVLVLHHTHQWRTEALETVGGIWKAAGGARVPMVLAGTGRLATVLARPRLSGLRSLICVRHQM